MGRSRQVHTRALEVASHVQTGVWGDLAEGPQKWLLLPSGKVRKSLNKLSMGEQMGGKAGG